ncbi:MAG: hypothetical protein ABII89_05635 [Candidatus Omnitrophota bacterium]
MWEKKSSKIWLVVLVGAMVGCSGRSLWADEKKPPLPVPREILSRVIENITQASKDETASVNGVRGKFSYTLSLSPSTYRSLSLPLANLFNHELTPEVNGSGTFRTKFDPGKDGLQPDQFFLEFSSAQWAFLFFMNKDEITFISPQLNLLVKDSYARFREMTGNRKEQLHLPEMGLPKTRKISSYLASLAEKLKANLDKTARQTKVSEVKKEGMECYRLSAPGENGEWLELDVYADSFVPATLKIISAARDLIITAEFQQHKNIAVSPFDYLPYRIVLSGERDGNKVKLEVKDIKYNPFFSADDFRLKEVNIAEFLGIVYFRAFSGTN